MANSILKKIRSGTDKERFNSSYEIVTESGCWIWMRSIDKDGYGIHYFNNKKESAHRKSYKLFKNEIPEKMLICHRCDNPSCVNPSHLFIGTAKDNAQDALKKKRNFIGSKNSRAILNEKNVIEIRNSNLSIRQLSEKYCVSVNVIKYARKKSSWAHLNES